MVKRRRGAAGREDGHGAGPDVIRSARRKEGSQPAQDPADRTHDRATRSQTRSTGRHAGTTSASTGRRTGANRTGICDTSGWHLVPGTIWTGHACPRSGLTGPLTGFVDLSLPNLPKSFTYVPFRPVGHVDLYKYPGRPFYSLDII